jgi:parvulin-like peptidyl-prolyl isomerase
MFGAIFRPLVASRWRRAALVGVAVAVAAAGTWLCRGGLAHRATAQSTPAAQTQPGQAADLGTDYSSRVVAFIHNNQPITRQELGEYLVARYGADKLQLLVNKRMLDRACQARGITINAAEVEAEFANELKGLAVDRATFVKTVLSRYKKNLYEFKEDVLRPRLQLTRLCQPTITVSEEDLRKAYESAYGEKVECRVIVWPASKEKLAQDSYASLRDSEDAFAKAAKEQEESGLAATGGRINPISRWSMDKRIEDEAFKLGSKQVSTLIKIDNSIFLLKCDRRIPADTAVNFNAVKAKLEPEIREAKLQMEIGKALKTLREQAKPIFYLQKTDKAEPATTPPTQVVATTPPSPTDVVATLNGGSEKVTREELGEFLIARLGGDKLGYLVNRRILEVACKEKNVSVSDEEVEAEFKKALEMTKSTPKIFEKELLAKMNKNLYEWREDAIRTKLLLAKLAAPRVTVTEDDLRKGFEAYYGERLRCRMILWPPKEGMIPRREYAKLRDSDAEFDRAARMQASPTLAPEGGKLPIFGRYAMGDENLEREAFRLQAGEISPVIETPQGHVIIKCDERIPPDTTKSLEQVRGKLTEEIKRKKADVEMQLVFKELSDKAAARLLLTGTGQPEDLAAESRRIMADLPNLDVPQPRR